MNNNTVPQNADQRVSERHGVQIDGQEHLFAMQVEGQSFPLTNIRDVSISGVGLEMTEQFDPGTPVILNYSEGNFDLAINGTIMWCRAAANSGSFALGVEFDSSNGGNNSLFFLAMRKYLDEFDGITMDV